MNIKIGILNVPKHDNKHDLIHFVTIASAVIKLEAFGNDVVLFFFVKDGDVRQTFYEYLHKIPIKLDLYIKQEC